MSRIYAGAGVSGTLWDPRALHHSSVRRRPELETLRAAGAHWPLARARELEEEGLTGWRKPRVSNWNIRLCSSPSNSARPALDLQARPPVPTFRGALLFKSTRLWQSRLGS